MGETEKVPDGGASGAVGVAPEVSPASSGQSQFVKEWLLRHRQKYTHYPDGLAGTYSGAELVKEALLLPTAQRNEVMAELHRMYGNSYVVQAMAGSIPNVEDQKKDTPEVPTILSMAYWAK